MNDNQLPENQTPENSQPQDQSSRQNAMGRYMIIGMWVLGLLLAILLVNRALERNRNPNNAVVTSYEAGKRSITLERGRHGHYLVTGQINGSSVDFLIDTGASSVSIPADFASKIGLRKGNPLQLSTANGISTAYETRVDSLTLGDLEIRNPTSHINPGLHGEVLLGMSVLKNYELIQRGNQLVIREP